MSAISHANVAAVLDVDPWRERGAPAFHHGILLRQHSACSWARPTRWKRGPAGSAWRPPCTWPARCCPAWTGFTTRASSTATSSRSTSCWPRTRAAPARSKLIDFGLSRLRGEKPAGHKGMVVGSPYYTAPEQEADPDSADARADIFSVGVTLYRMLTRPAARRGKRTAARQRDPHRPGYRVGRFFRACPGPGPGGPVPGRHGHD